MKYIKHIISIIMVILLTMNISNANENLINQSSTPFQKEIDKNNTKKIKIKFWHSFGGELGNILNKIIMEFNNSQNKYYVIGTNKSNYENSLTAAATAFRSGNQPNILLNYEIGTAMMIHSGGAFIPLHTLLKNTNIKINTNDFWPSVRGYYSEKSGLAGFPFNSSSPVLFYNKNIFKKAGINHPPSTWQEVNAISKKLIKVGCKCTFTSGYPSWILLEEFSAWNNLQFATGNNGFETMNPKLTYNNKIVRQFLNQLRIWSNKGIFMYGGRLGSSDSLYTSGKCAMTMESSSMITDFSKLAHFKTGVSKLPIWKVNDNSKPQNTIIGGGALWTFKAPKNTPNKKELYRGIALFYKFLSQPNIQAYWAKKTGYVPSTKSAYLLLKKEGFYIKNPSAKVALDELNNAPPKPYTKGIRLGNFPLIRQLNDSTIERIFSNQNSLKNTLSATVKSGNKLIAQFYQQNR